LIGGGGFFLVVLGFLFSWWVFCVDIVLGVFEVGGGFLVMGWGWFFVFIGFLVVCLL